MPLITISMIAGRTREEKRAVSDAIHSALVDAFRIPENDYNHRIAEYAEENFIRPDGKSEKYIIIELTVFPGRSKEAKKYLYKGIIERLSSLGVPKDDVLITINEPQLSNWGIRGGIPADEADIGFKLDV
jgi:phenylpyruvate tautomerase PptA (4-oxalocrotonate tautomerase family)